MMQVSEFDYHLPEKLIAQFPSKKRDHSRMMVLDRGVKTVKDKHFYDITDYFDENDVIVMNNTKVIPARLIGQKSTGARIEVFLLEEMSDRVWEAFIKPSKRVKPETEVFIADFLKVVVRRRASEDSWHVELQYNGSIYDVLDKVGNLPLPPYIERNLSDEEIKKLDCQRYQTVYAQNPGSVAAPTAGLHFTPEILDKLKDKGVEVHMVTLNVGAGTFKPVKTENIFDHKMHREYFEISERTAHAINEAKSKGKNIVAVGTTTVRALETTAMKYGKVVPVRDFSEMFIYPGYEFKVADKIITNFHLPKSTLLMLVSAFAGKEFIFNAYNQAISQEYRFFSYGDCMLIF